MRCNARFSGLLLFLYVLMSGCAEDVGFPPVLTAVVRPRTLPVQYIVGFNDGQAALVGEASFEDPDGDVLLLTVTWQDCGNGPVNRLDIVQEDLRRTTTGVIPFIVVISTDCPTGIYSVDLSAMDGRGYVSNVLSVPYEIYE